MQIKYFTDLSTLWAVALPSIGTAYCLTWFQPFKRFWLTAHPSIPWWTPGSSSCCSDWSLPLQMSCQPWAEGGSRFPPLKHQIRPLSHAASAPGLSTLPAHSTLMAATLLRLFPPLSFCPFHISVHLCCGNICRELTVVSLAHSASSCLRLCPCWFFLLLLSGPASSTW